MPPKLPHKIRKFYYGCEKRKKNKRLDDLTQSQSGALDKFIIKEPQISVENQNVDVGIIENMKENINVNATGNDSLDAENIEENANVNDIENDNLDDTNVDNANENATKDPKRVVSIVKDPKDKSSRCFTANLYTRILPN
ncbi:uncharacterized protein LOC127123833 [Lathyrus oleraceus]|uniref:uncharacterized protein LOC127123833 n=1 Tax=Pisum sativum TaxID=3888 RepID=UPI0021CE2FC4|nr:uncharacterized protein LOC127123833 [Pisum sativum]